MYEIPESSFDSDLSSIPEDKKILSLIEGIYTRDAPIWNNYQLEAQRDMKMAVGDQDMWNQFYGLTTSSRRQLYFNRISRTIEMVSGRQRQNRKTTIVTPQESQDQQVADDLSGVIQWAYNRSKAYEKISTAFSMSLRVGLSFIESWLDRRDDIVNGDLKHRVIDWNSVYCDPFYREPDLSDCSYVWVRRYIDKEQLKILMPDSTETIYAAQNDGQRDFKFQYMPENNQYSGRNLIAVNEFWYADTREARVLVNTKTGEIKEIKKDIKINPELFINVPELEERTIVKPTVRLAVVINRRVVYNGANPLGIDKYPFTPIYCYHEPSFNDWSYRFQGIVRKERDAQFVYNRMLTLSLDGVESQVNSGELVEEDFFLTPEDAMRSGNGQIRFFKKGKNPQLSRVREQPAQISAGIMQLAQLMGNEISEVSGVNQELLGSADDDKAGILSMLRQGAGLTTLQSIFDNLDFSQWRMGELDVEIMQKNWNKEKFARILGRTPSEEIGSPYVEKFDITVEEGMNTSTQRQMQAAQLFQAYQMGIQTPEMVELIIKTMNLQNKNELLESIRASREAQEQMAQQQAQMQAQNQMSENSVLQAKAESEIALARERMAKIESMYLERVETLEKAGSEQMSKVLDLIKSLKELESIDLNNLKQKFNTIQMLEQAQAPQQALQQPMTDNPVLNQQTPNFNPIPNPIEAL